MKRLWVLFAAVLGLVVVSTLVVNDGSEAKPRCPPNSNNPKCVPTTTTTSSTTTTAPDGNPPDFFPTLPVGSVLPSGAACADRVDPAPEQRARNAVYNQTAGTDPHDLRPRVDGNFTGTTDEILQWVACKWGINEDVVRAQTIRESYWFQEAGGDLTSNESSCAPAYHQYDPCPESIGVLQVRWDYHGEAFEDENAIRSTAYNGDYAYSSWRACFEGEYTWLNNVEHGRPYPLANQADQLWGCVGVWFAGRWYTDAAIGYIGRVQGDLANRVWTTAGFATAPCSSCYVPAN